MCANTQLVIWGFTALSAQIGYITQGRGGQHKYHAIKQQKNTIYHYTNTIISSLRPGLYGDDPLATVRLPHRGLSSQSLLASNDNLTRTTKNRTHINKN